MQIPERYTHRAELPDKTSRNNQRRLTVLIVVIFIAVLSFFAGRHTGHRPYTQQDVTNGQPSDPSGREGIPPDSLPH
jgi:hypothetical protein